AIPHSIHLRTTSLGPQHQPTKILRKFIVALSNKCPGCCKLIDGNQIACPRIESKRQRPTMVVGLCLLSAVVMVDPVRSIVSASQRRTSAVEWLVIEIGRDLVAGPPVTQVILGFPGGIDDQSVG